MRKKRDFYLPAQPDTEVPAGDVESDEDGE